MARIVWVDVLLSIGIIMVVVGVGISFKKSQGKTLGASTNSAKTSKISVVPTAGVRSATIMVDVGGAVVKPGVYEFLPKDRVIDALLRSGGLSAKADRAWVEANLNRAELLHDGQKIFIPEVSMASSAKSTNSTRSVIKDFKASINYGSEAELVAVNGIGPATAQAIIKFRQEKGLFGQLEDIMHVPGIGTKSFEKIKDQIKL